VIAYLVRFSAWTRLASIMELKASLRYSGKAYFLSMLARYIPGKIGMALVRVEVYSGHPPERVILATGMELVSALSAALLLTFAGLASSPAHFPIYLKWFALVGIALLLSALSPPVMGSVIKLLSRITGREFPGRIPPYRIILLLVGIYTIPGLVHGLGLFFLLNSLSPVPAEHYLAVTGAYYAASIVGILAVFAPGGLGVREGITMLVLPLIVPRENAIVAAVVIRLVLILAEIFLAGVFSLAARGKRS